MMRALIAVLFLAGCQTVPAPPIAETPYHICGPRADLLDALMAEYGEVPIWLGLGKDGSVSELLASPKSWSLLSTTPNGITCLINAGDDWGVVNPKRGTGA